MMNREERRRQKRDKQRLAELRQTANTLNGLVIFWTAIPPLDGGILRDAATRTLQEIESLMLGYSGMIDRRAARRKRA